jgi:hypothetical protein
MCIQDDLLEQRVLLQVPDRYLPSQVQNMRFEHVALGCRAEPLQQVKHQSFGINALQQSVTDDMGCKVNGPGCEYSTDLARVLCLLTQRASGAPGLRQERIHLLMQVGQGL